MDSFILPKKIPREHVILRVASFLKMLDPTKAWRVEINEFKSRRTLQQNAYLWGVVYPTVIKAGGEMLAGWTSDDLHEYFLGEYHGWETIQGFGKKRLRPIKRSSRLTISDFMKFLEFIQRRMAEHGVYIPDPNQGLKEVA